MIIRYCRRAWLGGEKHKHIVSCIVKSYNIIMKRVIYLLFSLCFLAACAGNPPAWWNPNNRYGTQEQAAHSSTGRAAQPATMREETFEVDDTSYEEETIAPLPEEEEIAAQPAEDNLPAPSVLE